MLNIIGQVIVEKSGKYKKVVSQTENYLFLNDGSSMQYYESFISGNIRLLDDHMQKLLEKDILLKVGVKNYKVPAGTKVSYEIERDILYVPMNQDFANVNFAVSGGFESMHAYGSVAQEIYREGCSNFSWDYSAVGYFAKMKLLYCEDVTPEGYAVWFLPHSNLNDSESNRWKNLISYDFNYIKEVWKDIDSTFDMFFDKDTVRLAFAKQSNQKYIFLGIYVCDYVDFENYIKIYKRVGLKYPK